MRVNVCGRPGWSIPFKARVLHTTSNQNEWRSGSVHAALRQRCVLKQTPFLYGEERVQLGLSPVPDGIALTGRAVPATAIIQATKRATPREYQLMRLLTVAPPRRRDAVPRPARLGNRCILLHQLLPRKYSTGTLQLVQLHGVKGGSGPLVGRLKARGHSPHGRFVDAHR